MLTTLLFTLEIKFVLKIESNSWGIKQILYYKTNREALTVLSSVIKHLGSIRALKKWGETLDYVSCFSLHSFRALAASCMLYNRREHSQGFSIC